MRAGARRVYLVFCDDVVVEVDEIKARSARELALELLNKRRYRGSLKDVVEAWRGPVFYLHERGVDIDRADIGPDSLVVVGDQDGLSRDDEEYLRTKATWVSLGPAPYLSWFCAPYVMFKIKRSSSKRA